MVVKCYCDMCKKEIDEVIYTLSVNPSDINAIYMPKHLCCGCLKKLQNIIDSIENEELENDRN